MLARQKNFSCYSKPQLLMQNIKILQQKYSQWFQLRTRLMNNFQCFNQDSLGSQWFQLRTRLMNNFQCFIKIPWDSQWFQLRTRLMNNFQCFNQDFTNKVKANGDSMSVRSPEETLHELLNKKCSTRKIAISSKSPSRAYTGGISFDIKIKGYTPVKAESRA